ncbi:CoA-binding protein [Bacteroidota bacterium]
MKKKTLVVGASANSARYAYKAVQLLEEKGHPVYAYGIKSGSIGLTEIKTDWPSEAFDTVTLYINPQHQKEYQDRIIDLKPARVIFNPGTENQVFEEKLLSAGIEVEQACTLVMLRVGTY